MEGREYWGLGIKQLLRFRATLLLTEGVSLVKRPPLCASLYYTTGLLLDGKRCCNSR